MSNLTKGCMAVVAFPRETILFKNNDLKQGQMTIAQGQKMEGVYDGPSDHKSAEGRHVRIWVGSGKNMIVPRSWVAKVEA